MVRQKLPFLFGTCIRGLILVVGYTVGHWLQTRNLPFLFGTRRKGWIQVGGSEASSLNHTPCDTDGEPGTFHRYTRLCKYAALTLSAWKTSKTSADPGVMLGSITDDGLALPQHWVLVFAVWGCSDYVSLKNVKNISTNSKQKTINWCWGNAGPASKPMGQHYLNIGSTSRVCSYISRCPQSSLFHWKGEPFECLRCENYHFLSVLLADEISVIRVKSLFRHQDSQICGLKVNKYE